MKPVLVDRTPLAGIIPMTRAWYDCGNGYGVSTVAGTEAGEAITIAAGLWMDRRPSRLTRLFRRTYLLHTTPERVHVASEEDAQTVVEYVAALPPLGVEVPVRMLPDCTFWWCVEHASPCTRGETP